jgi:hypothetical protein
MNLDLNRTNFFVFLFSLAFISACNSPQGESNDESSEIESLGDVPFVRNEGHDTRLLIAHKISDYVVWKASFDLAESVREKNGLKALNVFREREDSNLAIVFTEVTDLQIAKSYITSHDLQGQMLDAGVVDALDLFWLTKELNYTKPITDSITMFMSFNVISYDRWEKAFLNDYIEEPDRNFQVINVLRGVDDPNNVNMLFAVNDPDYVKKMESNKAFRAKMLASGVISYPTIYKFREMEL